MNITILLTEQVIIFCIMMLCGFGLVKFKILKSSDSKILSIISVYIIIPCVIINAFQIQYSDEIRDGFLLAIIAAILIHIILFSLMRVTQIFFKFTSVETASIIYSNAGNLVIPLVMSVLGHDWVIYSSAFLAVQTVLMWSHCLAVMSRTKLNLQNFIKIFTNLNLICVAIGLILFFTGFKPHYIIAQTMSQLAGLIGPVSLIMLGILLAGLNWHDFLRSRRLYLVIFFKMLLFPFIILLFLKFSGLASLVSNGKIILLISLLAYLTPSATTITQLALLYDNEPAYCGAINAFTTITCLVTMPLLTAIYLY